MSRGEGARGKVDVPREVVYNDQLARYSTSADKEIELAITANIRERAIFRRTGNADQSNGDGHSNRNVACGIGYINRVCYFGSVVV